MFKRHAGENQLLKEGKGLFVGGDKLGIAISRYTGWL
jgi:hypothetical protein